ncbi:MAG: AzlC family ABC transporter permease [Lachnospiraceae bacterium]|nr:AzlC family ABC transporter permease [Lachnospiraceae bacterium]
MKKKSLKRAFIKSLPVMVGYIVLGIGFGILLRNAGYGVLWAFAMSLFIFGGSMQYVGVGLLAGGATVINTIITTIMVNARHLFYSISMINRYKGAGKYKPYMIFALTDETYSLLCDEEVPDDIDVNLYRFLVSLFNHIYWIIGGVLGNLIGAVLPFSADGVAFSMTALFVAAFTEQWLSSKNHLPAITGVICTTVSLLLFGKDNFLIPAMLMITAVLAIAGRKEVAES